MPSIISQAKTQRTVRDIVDFVLKYRRGIVFADWNAGQIARAFSNAIDNKCCAVAFDEDDSIIGVAIGDVNDEYKLFHVENILCIHPMAIKLLIAKFIEVYPGYDLQGNRNGKLIRYKNTFRLLSKLIKQKA